MERTTVKCPYCGRALPNIISSQICPEEGMYWCDECNVSLDIIGTYGYSVKIKKELYSVTAKGMRGDKHINITVMFPMGNSKEPESFEIRDEVGSPILLSDVINHASEIFVSCDGVSARHSGAAIRKEIRECIDADQAGQKESASIQFDEDEIGSFESLQKFAFRDLGRRIGKNWLRLRNEKGLSREDLSALADVSVDDLERLESGTGENEASVDVCRRIAEAYGMPLAEFAAESLRKTGEDAVPSGNIWETDFSKVYPYNLINAIFFDEEALSPYIVNFKNVRAILAVLTEKQRRILLYRYRDGMSADEIGTKLRIETSEVERQEAVAVSKINTPLIRNQLTAYTYDEVRALRAQVMRLRTEKVFPGGAGQCESDCELIEIKKPGKPAVTIRNIPIEELGLSPRAYNCLKRAKIATAAELASLSGKELLKIRNLGMSSVEEIYCKLRARGFDPEFFKNRRAE